MESVATNLSQEKIIGTAVTEKELMKKEGNTLYLIL